MVITSLPRRSPSSNPVGITSQSSSHHLAIKQSSYRNQVVIISQSSSHHLAVPQTARPSSQPVGIAVALSTMLNEKVLPLAKRETSLLFRTSTLALPAVQVSQA